MKDGSVNDRVVNCVIARPRGFTLTELLVSLAIIAVLVALLLPAISRSKQKAQQVQCVSNLRQLGLALQSFADNNHAYPVRRAQTNSDYPGLWQAQLERGGFNVAKPPPNFISQGVWQCPSARLTPLEGHSNTIPSIYVYNESGLGDANDSLGLSGSFIRVSGSYAKVTESDVVSPSRMMAIADGFAGGVSFQRIHFDLLLNKYHALSRHSGQVNVVFCDDHVDSPGLGFVFTNTTDAALARWNRDNQPHRDRLRY